MEPKVEVNIGIIDDQIRSSKTKIGSGIIMMAFGFPAAFMNYPEMMSAIAKTSATNLEPLQALVEASKILLPSVLTAIGYGVGIIGGASTVIGAAELSGATAARLRRTE